MIVLKNGVRIFLRPSMKRDIYLGISNFGFGRDIGGVLGLAHLLEHVLISCDHRRFLANASTTRNFMSFWCKSLRSSQMDAVRELVSWFFEDGKLRVRFEGVDLRAYAKELENEYYFRNEALHCFDVLTFLGGGDLYNGGRFASFAATPDLPSRMAERMESISGPSLVIFLKQGSQAAVDLINATFGQLPRAPSVIQPRAVTRVSGKAVMTVTPFYSIMARVDATLDNALAVLALCDVYHLFDYETVGEDLFVVLSFVDESDYDGLLRGIKDLPLAADPGMRLNFDADDYAMNAYLNFSWMSHDILDYESYFRDNAEQLVAGLKRDVLCAIAERKCAVLYPGFTSSIFNAQDMQQHRLVMLSLQPESPSNKMRSRNHGDSAPVRLMRKTPSSNSVMVRFGDADLLSFVALSLFVRADAKMFRSFEGVRLQHRLTAEDMDAIMDSDTFLKFSRSRPAAAYQYIFLDFFASERSIEDIVESRSGAHRRNCMPHLVFKRNTRYDVVACSSFVCGVIKGRMLRQDHINSLMWKMKKMGIVYSLSCTPLKSPSSFYVFAFSLSQDEAFQCIARCPRVAAYCLVVAKRGPEDDFSALRKRVVLKMEDRPQ
ncbi:putative metalloprotease-like protein [Seal parapoxvirus]|uniref:Metalloendopeptidase n=1 Tax=Seal parapoxvirus TaxID=187984 RepID=A0A1Z3GCW3_9POXV|nr:putative metalloprotease-like protein [Seal parapoxvirus]ASC55601.1 putative metalloprotease-like protein [Seal parapoxvirus]